MYSFIFRDGVRQSGQANHENDSKMGEFILYVCDRCNEICVNLAYG